MIPLFKVYMAPDVDEFVMPVLRSGYIGEGEKCKQFEKIFGEYIENDNVVLVNSGTSAITMALKLAGVSYGDYVISTPVTCLATNMAILSVGANIIWADVLRDGTIDPDDVGRKAAWHWSSKTLGKLKAIMCMDWSGLPCRLFNLQDVASFYGIPIIEDACQSIGSIYKNMPVGHDAEYVAYSFQAIKHLTTGDGGALTINSYSETSSKIVEKAKMMRWFGLDRDSGADMRCNQDPPVAGYKWQMNDIAASIGLANIRGLNTRLAETKLHAELYNKEFGYSKETDRQSGYWLYTILMDDVDGFISYMKVNGVECSRVHDRNDKKSVFKNFAIDLPGVDYFDKHHVCIPVGWHITNKDVEKIVSLVKSYGS